MKAKELDPELFPKPELIKAYEEVGLKYEWTIHDRVYQYHFYPKATANNKLKEQEVKYQIDALHRTKNHDGEWLTYHVSLFAKDWKGNKIDYSYMEGKIEGMPEFHREVDPQTDEIIPGSTQVEEIKTVYKIPFSKRKVLELEKHFRDGVQFAINERNSGKTYNISQEQFTDGFYAELIAEVTGFSEYIKMRDRNKKYNGN